MKVGEVFADTKGGFGGLGFRERGAVCELRPGATLVEAVVEGGGKVVDEGTEGQVVRRSLDGAAACTGGSCSGLGVGDGEDRRRSGGHDGFRERMEGDFVICDFREREII